jgi:hypothetical protein
MTIRPSGSQPPGGRQAEGRIWWFKLQLIGNILFQRQKTMRETMRNLKSPVRSPGNGKARGDSESVNFRMENDNCAGTSDTAAPWPSD